MSAGGSRHGGEDRPDGPRFERWILGRTRRIHFVGIGGIGMSGIAEVLANLGYEVTGSDAKGSDVTARLSQLGVQVHIGHDAAHVGPADVVVVSSAIGAANPELVEAKRRRIPVIPRAEMLAELMRLRYGIAIAGAHGKTTTTSMVALVLERAGLDPTAVIGGRLSAFGSNARLGRGAPMVVEADESDRSFLTLSPAIALVTNIDREHMDAYGSWQALKDAFLQFINKVPFHGAAVLCVDDEPVRELLPRTSRRVITYGFVDASGSVQPDIAAEHMRLEPFASRCIVSRVTEGVRETLGEMTVAVPGRHNLLNALGAVAIGIELQVPFTRIASALAEFTGAERRFQVRGERHGVMVVDDYGHHPTEIRATLAAAKLGSGGRRIVVLFQPHRYTRTHDLMQEFARSFNNADVLFITDIYAASEDPIEGVTAEALTAAIKRFGHKDVNYIGPLDNAAASLREHVQSGDLVLTLGAGTVNRVSEQLLSLLREQSQGTSV